ncbi:MAG: bifunctional aspartate kinase/diaminopimelate decarboxylase [Glycocaulis sp.]
MATRPLVVMKFGGTSVASPKNWEIIARLARKHMADGERVLIVHSALSGVSNMLEALPAQALAGLAETAVTAIKDKHISFAREAGLDAGALLQDRFVTLDRLSGGIALIGEASGRVRAELMALGELMASDLGLALLRRLGMTVEGLDARTVLKAANESGDARSWLDNMVDESPDAALAARIAPHDVVLTQGFIASNSRGETVLLGRGGSDTSAAYFAAKAGAHRLEIWTDVPGLFSADPRLTDGARMLKALSYEEAQEIATMGGKVLHPRSIGPARRAGIPMLVKDTFRPDLAGTLITAAPGDDAPRLKAVSVKTSVRLVVMEGSGMWRQAGFLADVFACFKQCGVSVDQVSTSETNVTVSLDPDPGLDAARLEALRTALSPLCRVRIEEGKAAVSMVGYGIRRILHQLAPAFEVFQEKPVHLVSQAANDLNFTVVVDDGEDTRDSYGRQLAKRLHQSLISSAAQSAVFGPSWAEITAPAVSAAPAQGALPWWVEKRAALLEKAPAEGGLYVYDRETVSARSRAVAGLNTVSRAWYAMKANPHPELLKAVRAAGLGFECVSMGEVARVRETFPDIAPDEILFTPNFAPRAEYEAALALGTHITIDGLHPLKEWPELFRDREIILRVNPDTPRGHHAHVRTAGPKAKFGIALEQVSTARAFADSAGAIVKGLHAHAGSGITEAGHWQQVAGILAEAARGFDTVRILNVGGGLGVAATPDAPALDLAEVDATLTGVLASLPGFELWMEPGRYLVAEAGVLLARVTQIKDSLGTRFVGIGTGMNSLIRPALYGARHEIVNLTRLEDNPAGLASIVGPICESADLLGADRLLPDTREGDVLLIAEAGAYGAVMSSRYNLRDPADETVL